MKSNRLFFALVLLAVLFVCGCFVIVEQLWPAGAKACCGSRVCGSQKHHEKER